MRSIEEVPELVITDVWVRVPPRLTSPGATESVKLTVPPHVIAEITEKRRRTQIDTRRQNFTRARIIRSPFYKRKYHRKERLWR
jgi:hypothetical protein